MGVKNITQILLCSITQLIKYTGFLIFKMGTFDRTKTIKIITL